MNLFKDTTTRDILREIQPLVDQIIALESQTKNLGREEFARKTEEFYMRLDNGETLDDILPEAFALCREADWRILGKKPYPCQIQAGIILHKGMLAEMKTGEGKTLTATMPLYLNALDRKGAHLYTSNAYLARRDKEEMEPVYNLLGIPVHLVLDMNNAHLTDFTNGITYLDSDQGGFSFLNSRVGLAPQHLHYALLDEVDSVLIDRSNSPLLLASAEEKPAQNEQFTKMLLYADRFVQELDVKMLERDAAPEELDPEKKDACVIPADYRVFLTSAGHEKLCTAAEEFIATMDAPDTNDTETARLEAAVLNALRARSLYARDRDYVVKEDHVYLLNKTNGRILPNSRLADNLHQAIEIKEKVPLSTELHSMATIHLPGFYRMYDKLSSMTGTAGVGTFSETELRETYGLVTVQIPPNKPSQRIDHPVEIYATQAEKQAAVLHAVQQAHAKERPVLVGVLSIPEGKALSDLLTAHNLPHKLLTAENEAAEATIVAAAGAPGAITVATDMAGRGTDIALGVARRDVVHTMMNDPAAGEIKLTMLDVLHYYYGGPLIPQEFYNAFFEADRLEKQAKPNSIGLQWMLDNYAVPFLYPPQKKCQQKFPVYAEAARFLEETLLDAITQERSTAVYRKADELIAQNGHKVPVGELKDLDYIQTMKAPVIAGEEKDRAFYHAMQCIIMPALANLISYAYDRINRELVSSREGRCHDLKYIKEALKFKVLENGRLGIELTSKGINSDYYTHELEDILRNIPVIPYEVFRILLAKYRRLKTEAEARYAAQRQKVLDAGGLLVLGTGLHSSRRIDDQLRGRSGRQGDPGESCFFTSVEDELFVQFHNDGEAAKLNKKTYPFTETDYFSPMSDCQTCKDGKDYQTRKAQHFFNDRYDQLFVEHRELQHALCDPREMLRLLFDPKRNAINRFDILLQAQGTHEARCALLKKYGIQDAEPETLRKRLYAAQKSWETLFDDLQDAKQTGRGNAFEKSLYTWLTEKTGGAEKSPLAPFILPPKWVKYLPEDPAAEGEALNYASFNEENWGRFCEFYESIVEDFKNKYRITIGEYGEAERTLGFVRVTTLDYDLYALMRFAGEMLRTFPAGGPSIRPLIEQAKALTSTPFASIEWLETTGTALLQILFENYLPVNEPKRWNFPALRQILHSLQLAADMDAAPAPEERTAYYDRCHRRFELLCHGLLRIQYGLAKHALYGILFPTVAERNAAIRYPYMPWQDDFPGGTDGDVLTGKWLHHYVQDMLPPYPAWQRAIVYDYYLPVWQPDKIYLYCYRLWNGDKATKAFHCRFIPANLTKEQHLAFGLFLDLWLCPDKPENAGAALANAALYAPYSLTNLEEIMKWETVDGKKRLSVICENPNLPAEEVQL